MKLDTGIVITKGLCFLLAAIALQFGNALAQWANSGDHPSTLQWWIIGAGCAGAGANAVISYLSGAYTDYVRNRSTATGGGSMASDTAHQAKP